MAKDKPMMLADLPDKRRPEEFLTDARLVELYERELEAADEKSRPAIEARLKRARVAAALTAAG